MYAIVDIAGKQFKVSPDQHIYAPSLSGEAGSSVEFDRVLLMGDGDQVEVGAPAVSGARVAATIVEHGRADKVVIFKKKRRKGYKKKQGHRQGYTKVVIDEILSSGQQASPKKRPEPKPEPTEAKASSEESNTEVAPTDVAHELPASDPMTPASVDSTSEEPIVENPGSTEQDDLTKISGIGPVFAQELNRLGVNTYQQLADLSDEEIDRIDKEIVGADREMIKDQWIPQAKELMGK